MEEKGCRQVICDSLLPRLAVCLVSRGVFIMLMQKGHRIGENLTLNMEMICGNVVCSY